METNNILEALDQEILKLQQVRALLATNIANTPITNKRGRPKGSTNKSAAAAVPTPTKSTMSPEGKARIAAAQKKRWAAIKKAKTFKPAVVAKKQAEKQNAKPAKVKKAVSAKRAFAVKKAEAA